MKLSTLLANKAELRNQMQLSPNDLYLLSQCAISAAFQAGQIIANCTHDTLKIYSKKAGTSLASQLVTDVDHMSQAIILQILQPTLAIFDLALLTEENPDDQKRLEKDFFWCIDPLDGTLPFIEKTAGYAISIALVSRDGIPFIGVIYDPVEQTLYHAIKNTGVFRNGIPWQWQHPSDNKDKSLHFICDRSFIKHKHFTTVITELKHIAKTMGYTGITQTQQGGAAMNACWVLEKSPACYFKFPVQREGGGCLWDFAATACIFQEANAIVSDINGQILDLNRANSTFMNHRGILYATDPALAIQIKNLYKKQKSE